MATAQSMRQTGAKKIRASGERLCYTYNLRLVLLIPPNAGILIVGPHPGDGGIYVVCIYCNFRSRIGKPSDKVACNILIGKRIGRQIGKSAAAEVGKSFWAIQE